MQKKHIHTPARKTAQVFAKQFQIICFLLMLLLFSATAFAVTPTLAPTSVVSSTPIPRRSIIDSYNVQLFKNGAWCLLEKEMIAVHEDNKYCDGLLMFMPLSDFVSQTEIPRFRLTEDFNYHVIAMDPSVSLKYSHTIYNEEWEKILYGEAPTSDWKNLDSGKYLVSINVFTSDGERYASTASLFWLIVGDYDNEENIPVSTPTPTPTPTPSPTPKSSANNTY